MTRSIATASLLVWISLASASLAAEARPAVAPPGRCAEPRAAADARAEAYPVTGPVASLFDPLDVAAGPSEVGPQRPAPPSAQTLVRPGSCDRPGAGCGASAQIAPAVVVPPITPGVRPPRVPHSAR